MGYTIGILISDIACVELWADEDFEMIAMEVKFYEA
jgi:hypothetical protein